MWHVLAYASGYDQTMNHPGLSLGRGEKSLELLHSVQFDRKE